MAQGVPFRPPVSEVSDVIIAKRGIIQHIADYYNVHPETIYLYLHRNPELKPILDEQRFGSDDVDLDLAEHTMRYCMKQVESQTRFALDAAKFMLQSKGHKRGYNTVASIDKELFSKSNLTLLKEGIEKVYAEAKGGNED